MARPKGSRNSRVSERDVKRYVIELKRKADKGDTMAVGMLALVGVAANHIQFDTQQVA